MGSRRQILVFSKYPFNTADKNLGIEIDIERNQYYRYIGTEVHRGKRYDDYQVLPNFFDYDDWRDILITASHCFGEEQKKQLIDIALFNNSYNAQTHLITIDLINKIKQEINNQ